MQPQNNGIVYLAEGIVIAALVGLVAVLILVFSPLLWTDHLLTSYDRPIPTSCSLEAQGTPPIRVVHCPSWVQY